ncbi:MAG: M23 family metallopeptidase [Candidatus Thorarchaeota archaeon]|nr:M23 family metallopeptidase [Candidatus Thorarchaeota archaeon]
MRRQVCVTGVVVLLVVAVGVVFLLGTNGDAPDVFDNEDRYDSTVLNNMGVIYSSQSDIAYFNDGYSESDNCPWGFEHNGIDYFFLNNSPVIAASPGIVETIEIGYVPESTFYKVAVQVGFNGSIWLEYSFEGDSADEAVRAQQVSMLEVEVGDWVAKGDQIGRFLRPSEYDHIHFGLYLNDEAICPRRVMGDVDYNEIMSLIDFFHPGQGWELCYP